MTDKENLVELLHANVCEAKSCDECEYRNFEDECIRYALGKLADHLIANGVTFAEDNNVPSKWIPVTERLPEPFISVLVQMPGEEPFPTVREGFISNDGIWQSAMFRREPGEVTHWQPMPQPPRGEK